MLFRQQSRHATAPNTTTSMTDVSCYRTAIIKTTLVVDESLCIYPTVEGCGVPGPVYQNFPSLVTPPYDGLNSIRLALWYDDLLEFWFVERTVQFITVAIGQTIHWWVGSVRVNNRKQFFCPVRHVPLFEVSFRFAERRGSVVVITSAWHAAGRWFDSRTRHVSLLGVKTWLSTGIVYL